MPIVCGGVGPIRCDNYSDDTYCHLLCRRPSDVQLYLEHTAEIDTDDDLKLTPPYITIQAPIPRTKAQSPHLILSARYLLPLCL